MYAALHGNSNNVRLLLKSGADPNIRNEAGATAIMRHQRNKVVPPDGRNLRILLHPPNGDPDETWDIGGGGNLHRVFQRWDFSKGGSWTPDGSYFVFTATLHPGVRSFIAAFCDRQSFFHPEASLPTQLACARPFEFMWAVPGFDGEKIFALGLHHRPELARYDARLKEFIPYLRGIPAYWANLSPDGQSVAYLSLPQHALWRARPDGAEPFNSPSRHWKVICSRNRLMGAMSPP